MSDTKEAAESYLACAAKCGITTEEAVAIIDQLAWARACAGLVSVQEGRDSLRGVLEKMGQPPETP